MDETRKSKKQLIAELLDLRARIATLERVDEQQKQLQIATDQFRQLIENIPTISWISRSTGQRLFISDNAEKVFGCSADEIVSGGDQFWLRRIHPDDQKRVNEAYQRLFSLGKPFKVEYKIQKKDGQWAWILDRAVVVSQFGDQPLAYGISTDISESKQVEEALQLYIDRIEILYQINQSILLGSSTTEIVQFALRWIRQLIPCDLAGVALLTGKNQVKILALDPSGNTKLTPGTTIKPDQFGGDITVYEQLRRGQIVFLDHHTSGSLSELKNAESIQNSALVPMIYEGDLIGLINLSWVGAAKLTSVQEDIAREVAAQLSIAIRQTQLQEVEIRRKKELEILQQISIAMRYAKKLEDLYAILFRELKALFSIEAGAIFLRNARKIECEFVYWLEPLKQQVSSSSQVKEILLQNEKLHQAIFEPNQGFGLPNISSAAILPLQSQEIVLGDILLFWKDYHEFSEAERHLLNTVADVVGIAMHRLGVMETLEQRIEDRTRKLSALYGITAVSSSLLDLQEILDKSLEKIIQAMACNIGIILLLDESGKFLKLVSCKGKDPALVNSIISSPQDFMLSREVLKRNEVVIIDDLESDPDAPEFARKVAGCPYAGAPIRVKDRVIGVLSLIGVAGSWYDEEATSLLTSISDQIGIAVENHQLYEQAQQAAILSERQRLARDLHDSVTQSIYSLTLMAETGQKLLASGGDLNKVAHTFQRLGTTAHQALKEMRLLLYQLRPSSLEKEGLVDALRQRLEAVEGRAGIQAKLQADPIPKLPAPLEEGLYHIAQEALNNALKHAECTQTSVTLRQEGEWLVLQILDNGRGIDLQQLDRNPGMGLNSMRERASLVGGNFTITSQPGSGTCVEIRVKPQQGET